eukprot:6213247-Pleurochrysis_carterae.AAC.8
MHQVLPCAAKNESFYLFRTTTRCVALAAELRCSTAETLFAVCGKASLNLQVLGRRRALAGSLKIIQALTSMELSLVNRRHYALAQLLAVHDVPTNPETRLAFRAWVGIGDEGCIALADVLKLNTALTSVVISSTHRCFVNC